MDKVKIMPAKLPAIVQYQGSKRKLAPQILRHMPMKFDRLIEPFAGMAAISIAVAHEQRAKRFLINDINRSVLELLKQAVEAPDKLLRDYSAIWKEQFSYVDGHINHYYKVREDFNKGHEDPAIMLYLLARCVKGAVRYGKNGNFNQSPDKRRHGTRPETLERNIFHISGLMKGKVEFLNMDYQDVLAIARSGDIVYMDPPYQGVTNARDRRYVAGVDVLCFANEIRKLDDRGLEYIINYDGKCGAKQYGIDLPDDLSCSKIMLDAGYSSQSILLGKKDATFESLYVCNALLKKIN